VDDGRDGGMTHVVRRADTVVRTGGPWTPTVHALLRHLRSGGAFWVPEPLGRLGDGREVLSFLKGEVPGYPLPASVWAPSVLEAAGRLLRALHDASAGFPLEGGTWQLPAHAPAEVVCHNDFAPHNLVFRGGLPVAVIDFDTSSPGPRVWDLAYLAYRLVPLTAPGHPETPASSGAARAERLDALCAAYAGGAAAVRRCSPAEVLAMALPRVEELAAFTAGRARAERSAVLAGHVALYRRDAESLRDLVGETRRMGG
jgi:Ser/Thr protein kinase RdoA (MazF antagonist)